MGQSIRFVNSFESDCERKIRSRIKMMKRWLVKGERGRQEREAHIRLARLVSRRIHRTITINRQSIGRHVTHVHERASLAASFFFGWQSGVRRWLIVGILEERMLLARRSPLDNDILCDFSLSSRPYSSSLSPLLSLSLLSPSYLGQIVRFFVDERTA